ncbi:MAG: PCRF domain-containing protein [Candidatus Shikimatogenerans bostrichidophilus]|nr:MAG: PCRF domain-containing protein [Candidatus Shikimatogenerans bostrichidophilus]
MKKIIIKFKEKYKDIYNFINFKQFYLKKKYNKNNYINICKVFSLYNKYINIENKIKDLKSLNNNIKNNLNLNNEIKNELKILYIDKGNLKNKIFNLLKVIKIKNKIKSNLENNEAILELRSGSGGDEATLFVKDIFRMYIMYFKKKKIGYNILNTIKSKTGYREVILHIKKKGIYDYLKYESGVHRVQRIPKTETQGRLHTSAITVAVLPKLNEFQINIKSTDIIRNTFRSSGAGGQHVNKTESAIRLIHKPTNIIVECQDERSQHKNYSKALTILRSKIFEYEKLKTEKTIEKKRKKIISTGDRSKKIRTYNYPQNRVTDHRINISLYNLDNILNGDIEKMINLINKYYKSIN